MSLCPRPLRLTRRPDPPSSTERNQLSRELDRRIALLEQANNQVQQIRQELAAQLAGHRKHIKDLTVAADELRLRLAATEEVRGRRRRAGTLDSSFGVAVMPLGNDMYHST